MAPRSGIYSGACWTVQSGNRDASVSLAECEPDNVSQLFIVKNAQIWSAISPDPMADGSQYCVVYERSSALRTRRCYATEIGELYTRAQTSTVSPMTGHSHADNSDFVTTVSPISTPSIGELLLLKLVERLGRGA